jgi:hypothetical protein
LFRLRPDDSVPRGANIHLCVPAQKKSAPRFATGRWSSPARARRRPPA